MADPTAVAQQLAVLGYRATGPRLALVELAVKQKGPFAADELHRDAVARGVRVSRATVFRTLELLTKLGALSRIHSTDGCHRYTVCEQGHHHHLVCVNCGLVVPVTDCTLAEQIRPFARQMKFRVESHHLEFFGRCSTCQNGAKTLDS